MQDIAENRPGNEKQTQDIEFAAKNINARGVGSNFSAFGKTVS
jgi:hypothetical protein